MGWLRVMGVRLDDELIARGLREAESALCDYVRPDGRVTFAPSAPVLTGSR